MRGTIVNVAASASDNIGVVQVQFYENGSLMCTVSAAPYQCSMRIPKRRGQVTIEARAYDKAGNIGKSSIVVYSK